MQLTFPKIALPDLQYKSRLASMGRLTFVQVLETSQKLVADLMHSSWYAAGRCHVAQHDRIIP